MLEFIIIKGMEAHGQIYNNPTIQLICTLPIITCIAVLCLTLYNFR